MCCAPEDEELKKGEEAERDGLCYELVDFDFFLLFKIMKNCLEEESCKVQNQNIRGYMGIGGHERYLK